jgi:salicylate 5-hydroxylase small subunit
MGLPLALRIEIEDLLSAYGAVLDAGDLDQWPDFFVDNAFYQVIPRDNYDRGLPLALIRCESKGMLQDRVHAIRETLMYEPRYLRHVIGGVRVLGQDEHGIRVEANYAVFETPSNEPTRVFNVGRYLDRIVQSEVGLKFAEKHCIFDSLLIPNSIVFPI